MMAESDLKIFDGHRMILEDEEFVGRVRETVEARIRGRERVVPRHRRTLGASMLSVWRMAICANARPTSATSAIACCAICARKTARGRSRKPTIIVAEELTLSQLTMVSHENLVGIALQSGGVTSHAAILARSFEIPTVVGVEHLMESVEREATRWCSTATRASSTSIRRSDVEKDYVSADQALRQLQARADGRCRTSRPLPATAHRVQMLANIALYSRISRSRCVTAPRASVCCVRSFRFSPMRISPTRTSRSTLVHQDVAGVRPAAGHDSHSGYRRR